MIPIQSIEATWRACGRDADEQTTSRYERSSHAMREFAAIFFKFRTLRHIFFFPNDPKWDYVLIAHICARKGHPPMRNHPSFAIAAAVLSFAAPLAIASPINPLPSPIPHANLSSPINPLPSPIPHANLSSPINPLPSPIPHARLTL